MTPLELRDARISLGFSQKKLAIVLGVHRLFVLRWEAGSHKIPHMLELAIRELERQHESDGKSYRALASTRFLEDNAKKTRTLCKELSDLNDLELRRIAWACLTYWNSEPNPVDERVICYSWIVRCYEARFGKTFDHSRLRRLAHLGLLTKDHASRCGTRRYYRINAPAKLTEFLNGCNLDLSPSSDFGSSFTVTSPDS